MYSKIKIWIKTCRRFDLPPSSYRDQHRQTQIQQRQLVHIDLNLVKIERYLVRILLKSCCL